MRFQIPARGEEPSEEMIAFLHDNPLDWDGDDEGINLEVEGHEESEFGDHGDFVIETNGVYRIEKG